MNENEAEAPLNPPEETPPAPHIISMVAWDAPLPAAIGVAAPIKIGAQCSQGCDLTGQSVTLSDGDGAPLSTGVLDRPPAPETPSLHWAELAFTPVGETGVRFFRAACAPNLDEPHTPASCAFSFRVDPRPAHLVTVRVTYEPTGEVVDDVEVRLGHYGAYTDSAGEVRLSVPSGTFELSIRKMGYKAAPYDVVIAADRTIQVLAGKGETREELEARLSAMEDRPWG
jgi:hypothetical protein